MLIGLTGFISSGKGTVANILTTEYDFIGDSFASSVKDVCAAIFGWDRQALEGATDDSRQWRETVDLWWSKKLSIDNFTPRMALQMIGTDIMRGYLHDDIWILSLERRLTTADTVISDVRFPNEANLIRRLGGKVVSVDRVKPEWYNVAKAANNGEPTALDKMHTTYSHVHRSEWALVGYEPDYTVHNRSTKDDLAQSVKHMLYSLKRH